MFRLDKIEIWGFKSERGHIIYDFPDSNTTVVYGQNGCGKTSFLKIIYGIFSEDEMILRNNKVRKVKVWCQNNNKNIEFCISEKEEFSEDIGSPQYDWSQMEHYGLDRIPVLLLGVERSYSFSAVSASPSMIYEFLRKNNIGQKIIGSIGVSAARKFSEALSSQIDYNNRIRLGRFSDIENLFSREHLYLIGNEANIENVEELIVGRYRLSKMIANKCIQKALMETLSQIMEQKENIQTKDRNYVDIIISQLESNYELVLEVIKLANIKENDVLAFLKNAETEDIIKKCKENKNTGLLLENIINSIIPHKKVLLSIPELQKIFNEKIGFGKAMDVRENGIIIKTGYGDYHDVKSLSSGEKQFLTLLTCIFIDSTDRKLVLIDEPELSLNITWQSELIDLLMENSEDTQILLAVHSPAIVDEHIECLEELQLGE